mgnify:CR=1 FL=1
MQRDPVLYVRVSVVRFCEALHVQYHRSVDTICFRCHEVAQDSTILILQQVGLVSCCAVFTF